MDSSAKALALWASSRQLGEPSLEQTSVLAEYIRRNDPETSSPDTAPAVNSIEATIFLMALTYGRQFGQRGEIFDEITKSIEGQISTELLVQYEIDKLPDSPDSLK